MIESKERIEKGCCRLFSAVALFELNELNEQMNEIDFRPELILESVLSGAMASSSSSINKVICMDLDRLKEPDM